MLGFVTIDLNEGRHFGDCAICGEEKRLDHAVGYCCEPTHDPIGSMSTMYPGDTVGGRLVCQPCHDDFYYPEKTNAT